jgi:serine protease Do
MQAAPTPPRPPQPPADPNVFAYLRGSGSFLGVGVQDITAERAKALNLREEYGVEVTHVEDNSPAAKAGLKTGDVVLQYNGQRVEGTEQFVRLVRETPTGRKVNLTVSRGGSQQTLTAATEARKNRIFVQGGEFRFDAPVIHLPDIPRASMMWGSSSLGMVGEAIDDQIANYFGVKEGVLVRSVTRGSAAEKAGLKAGDVITRVDGKPVKNPREITSEIRSKRDQKTFPLTVTREKRETTLTVTVEDQSDSGGRGRSRARPVRAAEQKL